MDASDKLRRDFSKAVWLNYKSANLTPQGNCTYTCGAALNTNTACVINYTSFEQRYQVAYGRQNCSTCPTGASTFCL